MKLKRWALLLVTTTILTACGASAASYNNQGNRDFAREQYDEALNNYTAAKQEDPTLAEPYYNAGNALYHQGNLESATEELQQSLRAEAEALVQNSFYNLGNTYFQGQQWQEAIDAYVQALLISPDDQQAKINLELALQNRDQQQQQQQQQGQNSQQQQQPNQGGGNQQQQQQQQPQDQNENQNDSQGEGDQEQDQGESGQNDQQQEPQPDQGELSREEAEQLLDALGQDSQTLQERLQQQYGAPALPPAQDW